MAAEKRPYVVTVRDKDGKISSTRLVNAGSQAQAIRYVARPLITAEPASGEDLYDMGRKSVVMEDPDAKPPA